MLRFLSHSLKKCPPHYLILIFVIFFSSFFHNSKISASENPETLAYVIKASFIHNFTKFIQWPWESNSFNNLNEFNLCVMGENPFGTILDHLAETNRIKGRSISIKTDIFLHETKSCHILFISQSKRSKVERIVNHLKDFPVLTIGDTEGYAGRGVGINLIIVGNKIQFRINREVIEQSGLEVSSELLELATNVNGRAKP